MTELRSTDDVLADMDALLAEIPEQAPAPAPEPTTPEPTTPPPPPAPAPAPEPETVQTPEAMADEWEKITNPRPESDRTRTVRRDGWAPRDLPESLQPEPAAAWPPLAPTAPTGPDPAAPTAPTMPTGSAPAAPTPPPPAARPTPIAVTKNDDQDDDQPDQDGAAPADEQPAKPSTSTLIATTVGEWRLPPKLGHSGWLSALAYTGAAAGIGIGTGFTQGTYVTLDTLPISTAAVSGVAISVGLIGLAIQRSAKTFILFGAVLVLVLILQFVSIPVGTGLLATLITWGLDQRARTMRQPVALAARSLFTAVALATCALTWTTVVPLLTGATQ
ncbi:hypothetical protein ACH4RG_23255 [Streptomyces sp. NPDC021019]|uniref:hypothetical protein n=1 Tax=Streptomyces sp. NPDC021019 TaxID=3365108 RepID=UPI0037AB5933